MWAACVSAVLCLWLQSAPSPTAVSGQHFVFDYADVDKTSAGVVRFEQQLDGGAWTDVGLPPVASTTNGLSTYTVPIPALTPGPHAVTFRACNPTICSDAPPPYAFSLVVKPNPPQHPALGGL